MVVRQTAQQPTLTNWTGMWHRGSGADPLVWRGLGAMWIAVISPPTALEGISDLDYDLMGTRPSAVGVVFRL